MRKRDAGKFAARTLCRANVSFSDGRSQDQGEGGVIGRVARKFLRGRRDVRGLSKE